MTLKFLEWADKHCAPGARFVWEHISGAMVVVVVEGRTLSRAGVHIRHFQMGRPGKQVTLTSTDELPEQFRRVWHQRTHPEDRMCVSVRAFWMLVMSQTLVAEEAQS